MTRRLPESPFLYPLTDSTLGRAAAPALVAELVRGGARMVQLREKDVSDRVLLRLAREAVLVAASARALLIVNDRVDVALLAGAAGVHLGVDDIDAKAARRLGGEELIIGVSTHGREAALRAADTEPVDYVALGPIYTSATKPGRPALGLEVLRAVKDRTAVPIVAIGGITEARLAEVVAAGADGIAVISAIMAAAAVEPATRRMVAALQLRR